jgi:uncharacterized protein (DUF2141 family)
MSRRLSANSVRIQRFTASSDGEQGRIGVDLPDTLPRIARHLPAKHFGLMMTSMTPRARASKGLLAAAARAATLAVAVTPADAAAQYRQKIGNDMSRCDGSSPAVRVNVTGIQSASGIVRVQLYRGTKADWLQSGRWLYRVEAPAKAGAMSFCLPAPGAGTYGVAVRHDANGNGKTDLSKDGGGMSNNPSINILNLGKPSYTKTAFAVGDGVKSISIHMRYL